MVVSRRLFLQAGVGLLPWGAVKPLTMQLDWHLNAQFAGLCVAQAQGYYRRQGLAVTLNPATPGMDIVQTVVSNPATVGCAEESLILDAQARGVDVVAIAAMLQASPLALMSMPHSGLTTLQQLIGKRVGVHDDGRKALELVLKQQHIDPLQLDIIDIPYTGKHKRLINGEFDAVQCYALDEPIDLTRRLGQSPGLLSLKNYGFDAYSQVIFVASSWLTTQPRTLHRFLKATFAGWRWAIAHPSKTAKILVDHYVEPDYRDINYQTASLKSVANYVQSGGSQPIGVISPQRWQQSTRQLARAGLIEKVPPLTTSVDVSLWP
ncbi:MAG: ABC transporter substrate-binding protein [Cyanobacteria bacterium P01_D01_bin.56]